MPKVTIYILNFNYGRYISQAIKSVLSQTYDNLEISFTPQPKGIGLGLSYNF